jgi:hypothetical protein
MDQLRNITSLPIVRMLAMIALVISAIYIGYSTMKKESMEDVVVEDKPLLVVKQEVNPLETSEFADSTLPEVSEGEITPEDLLPKTSDVKAFEAQFPIGQGDVSGKNFLAAGHSIGINTVSSSLKNANLQLRSDPYIPRENTGPWNQSTIMSSDLTNRKSFEIGSSC